MNRRSLISAIGVMFGVTAADAFPIRRKSGESLEALQSRADAVEWGREFMFCDGTCSFHVLPLLNGTMVGSLSLMHINYGEQSVVDARFAELEARYVGYYAGALAFMGPREHAYQNGVGREYRECES